MSAFECPRCQAGLQHTRSGDLRWWACPAGHGRTFNLSVLRKRAGKAHYQKFWGVLRKPAPTGSVRCPSCRMPMEVSGHESGSGSVELDFCRSCQLLWFDEGELESLTPPAPEDKPNPIGHLDADARNRILRAEAELMMAASHPGAGSYDQPSDTGAVATLGSLLGFPVEDNAPIRRSLPLLSWTLAVAMLGGGVWALLNMDQAWELAGFYGEEPFRGGGLPAVLSLVVDPRPFSVLLNVGVVVRLGDNVEDVLGHAGFGLLCAAATLAAWGVHAAVMYTPGNPMMGLTAAAAAMAVFYAMRFPTVRLGWYQLSRSLPHRPLYLRGLSSRDGLLHPRSDVREGRWSMIGIRWAVAGWLVVSLVQPWLVQYPPSSWLEAVVGALVGGAVYLGFGGGVVRHPDELKG